MRHDIVLVGLNHRTAGVDVRERFALAEHCQPDTWAVPCADALSEALILSTCNRVELVGVGADAGSVREHLLRSWAGARHAEPEDLAPYLYEYTGDEAVRHLFAVASSLDSMVLGEPQILGQLKQAYRRSVESRATGVILNRLLHKAFSVAKRVRTETAVAANAVSISYAAVELARRIFGDMPSHRALLVGAGEMAELAAMHLLQAGIDEIVVVNRTRERAVELAKRFHGKAAAFEELPARIAEADIVITSTGSPEPVIRARDLRAVLKTRKNRPMFFIDIAVPRDIDPDVNGLDNVYLYDIDDLREVVEENLAGRREEAAKAGAILDEEVALFSRWLESLESQPTIVELVRRGERAAEEELARTLKRLGPLDENQRAAITAMAHAIAHKLNHAPIMFLKEDGMAREGAPARVNLVRRVFALDAPPGRHGRGA